MEIMEQSLDSKIPLKTTHDIETAIAFFNDTSIMSLSRFTPTLQPKSTKYNILDANKKKLKQRRKLRKKWQTTRFPDDKKQLNKLTKEIKELLKHEKDKKTKHLL